MLSHSTLSTKSLDPARLITLSFGHKSFSAQQAQFNYLNLKYFFKNFNLKSNKTEKFCYY